MSGLNNNYLYSNMRRQKLDRNMRFAVVLLLLLSAFLGCRKNVDNSIDDAAAVRLISIYFVDSNQQNIIGLDSNKLLPSLVTHKVPDYDDNWHPIEWMEGTNGLMFYCLYFKQMMEDPDNFYNIRFDKIIYFQFKNTDIDTLYVLKAERDTIGFYWNGQLAKSIPARNKADTLYIHKEIK